MEGLVVGKGHTFVTVTTLNVELIGGGRQGGLCLWGGDRQSAVDTLVNGPFAWLIHPHIFRLNLWICLHTWAPHSMLLVTSLKFPFHWVPYSQELRWLLCQPTPRPLALGINLAEGWEWVDRACWCVNSMCNWYLLQKLLPCFLWEKLIFSLWAKSNFRCSDTRFFTLIHAGSGLRGNLSSIMNLCFFFFSPPLSLSCQELRIYLVSTKQPEYFPLLPIDGLFTCLLTWSLTRKKKSNSSIEVQKCL